METIQTRGMPARGSLQDRIACEMVARERQHRVAEQAYLGRIFASGIGIPDKMFKFWTDLLSMEIHQENYSLRTIESKKKALETIEAKGEQSQESRVRMFNKLHRLTVRDDDMRPATAADIERFKRRLRKRHVRKRDSS